MRERGCLNWLYTKDEVKSWGKTLRIDEEYGVEKTKLIKEDRYTSTRLYRKTAWHVSRERARHRFPAMAASRLFLIMIFITAFWETASVCIRSGSPELKPYARLFLPVNSREETSSKAFLVNLA